MAAAQGGWVGKGVNKGGSTRGPGGSSHVCEFCFRFLFDFARCPIVPAFSYPHIVFILFYFFLHAVSLSCFYFSSFADFLPRQYLSTHLEAPSTDFHIFHCLCAFLSTIRGSFSRLPSNHADLAAPVADHRTTSPT